MVISLAIEPALPLYAAIPTDGSNTAESKAVPEKPADGTVVLAEVVPPITGPESTDVTVVTTDFLENELLTETLVQEKSVEDPSPSPSSSSDGGDLNFSFVSDDPQDPVEPSSEPDNGEENFFVSAPVDPENDFVSAPVEPSPSASPDTMQDRVLRQDMATFFRSNQLQVRTNGEPISLNSLSLTGRESDNSCVTLNQCFLTMGRESGASASVRLYDPQNNYNLINSFETGSGSSTSLYPLNTDFSHFQGGLLLNGTPLVSGVVNRSGSGVTNTIDFLDSSGIVRMTYNPATSEIITPLPVSSPSPLPNLSASPSPSVSSEPLPSPSFLEGPLIFLEELSLQRVNGTRGVRGNVPLPAQDQHGRPISYSLLTRIDSGQGVAVISGNSLLFSSADFWDASAAGFTGDIQLTLQATVTTDEGPLTSAVSVSIHVLPVEEPSPVPPTPDTEASPASEIVEEIVINGSEQGTHTQIFNFPPESNFRIQWGNDPPRDLASGSITRTEYPDGRVTRTVYLTTRRTTDTNPTTFQFDLPVLAEGSDQAVDLNTVQYVGATNVRIFAGSTAANAAGTQVNQLSIAYDSSNGKANHLKFETADASRLRVNFPALPQVSGETIIRTWEPGAMNALSEPNFFGIPDPGVSSPFNNLALSCVADGRCSLNFGRRGNDGQVDNRIFMSLYQASNNNAALDSIDLPANDCCGGLSRTIGRLSYNGVELKRISIERAGTRILAIRFHGEDGNPVLTLQYPPTVNVLGRNTPTNFLGMMGIIQEFDPPDGLAFRLEGSQTPLPPLRIQYHPAGIDGSRLDFVMNNNSQIFQIRIPELPEGLNSQIINLPPPSGDFGLMQQLFRDPRDNSTFLLGDITLKSMVITYDQDRNIKSIVFRNEALQPVLNAAFPPLSETRAATPSQEANTIFQTFPANGFTFTDENGNVYTPGSMRLSDNQFGRHLLFDVPVENPAEGASNVRTFQIVIPAADFGVMQKTVDFNVAGLSERVGGAQGLRDVPGYKILFKGAELRKMEINFKPNDISFLTPFDNKLTDYMVFKDNDNTFVPGGNPHLRVNFPENPIPELSLPGDVIFEQNGSVAWQTSDIPADSVNFTLQIGNSTPLQISQIRLNKDQNGNWYPGFQIIGRYNRPEFIWLNSNATPSDANSQSVNLSGAPFLRINAAGDGRDTLTNVTLRLNDTALTRLNFAFGTTHTNHSYLSNVSFRDGNTNSRMRFNFSGANEPTPEEIIPDVPDQPSGLPPRTTVIGRNERVGIYNQIAQSFTPPENLRIQTPDGTFRVQIATLVDDRDGYTFSFEAENVETGQQSFFLVRVPNPAEGRNRQIIDLAQAEFTEERNDRSFASPNTRILIADSSMDQIYVAYDPRNYITIVSFMKSTENWLTPDDDQNNYLMVKFPPVELRVTAVVSQESDTIFQTFPAGGVSFTDADGTAYNPSNIRLSQNPGGRQLLFDVPVENPAEGSPATRTFQINIPATTEGSLQQTIDLSAAVLSERLVPEGLRDVTDFKILFHDKELNQIGINYAQNTDPDTALPDGLLIDHILFKDNDDTFTADGNSYLRVNCLPLQSISVNPQPDEATMPLITDDLFDLSIDPQEMADMANEDVEGDPVEIPAETKAKMQSAMTQLNNALQRIMVTGQIDQVALNLISTANQTTRENQLLTPDLSIAGGLRSQYRRFANAYNKTLQQIRYYSSMPGVNLAMSSPDTDGIQENYRNLLSEFANAADPNDPSLRPGETFLAAIAEEQSRLQQLARDRDVLWTQALSQQAARDRWSSQSLTLNGRAYPNHAAAYETEIQRSKDRLDALQSSFREHASVHLSQSLQQVADQGLPEVPAAPNIAQSFRNGFLKEILSLAENQGLLPGNQNMNAAVADLRLSASQVVQLADSRGESIPHPEQALIFGLLDSLLSVNPPPPAAPPADGEVSFVGSDSVSRNGTLRFAAWPPETIRSENPFTAKLGGVFESTDGRYQITWVAQSPDSSQIQSVERRIWTEGGENFMEMKTSFGPIRRQKGYLARDSQGNREWRVTEVDYANGSTDRGNPPSYDYLPEYLEESLVDNVDIGETPYTVILPSVPLEGGKKLTFINPYLMEIRQGETVVGWRANLESLEQISLYEPDLRMLEARRVAQGILSAGNNTILNNVIAATMGQMRYAEESSLNSQLNFREMLSQFLFDLTGSISNRPFSNEYANAIGRSTLKVPGTLVLSISSDNQVSQRSSPVFMAEYTDGGVVTRRIPAYFGLRLDAPANFVPSTNRGISRTGYGLTVLEGYRAGARTTQNGPYLDAERRMNSYVDREYKDNGAMNIFATANWTRYATIVGGVQLNDQVENETRYVQRDVVRSNVQTLLGRNLGAVGDWNFSNDWVELSNSAAISAPSSLSVVGQSMGSNPVATPIHLLAIGSSGALDGMRALARHGQSAIFSAIGVDLATENYLSAISNEIGWWRNDDEESMQALAQGTVPPSLSSYLYRVRERAGAIDVLNYMVRLRREANTRPDAQTGARPGTRDGIINGPITDAQRVFELVRWKSPGELNNLWAQAGRDPGWNGTIGFLANTNNMLAANAAMLVAIHFAGTLAAAAARVPATIEAVAITRAAAAARGVGTLNAVTRANLLTTSLKLGSTYMNWVMLPSMAVSLPQHVITAIQAHQDGRYQEFSEAAPGAIMDSIFAFAIVNGMLRRGGHGSQGATDGYTQMANRWIDTFQGWRPGTAQALTQFIGAIPRIQNAENRQVLIEESARADRIRVNLERARSDGNLERVGELNSALSDTLGGMARVLELDASRAALAEVTRSAVMSPEEVVEYQRLTQRILEIEQTLRELYPETQDVIARGAARTLVAPQASVGPPLTAANNSVLRSGAETTIGRIKFIVGSDGQLVMERTLNGETERIQGPGAAEDYMRIQVRGEGEYFIRRSGIPGEPYLVDFAPEVSTGLQRVVNIVESFNRWLGSGGERTVSGRIIRRGQLTLPVGESRARGESVAPTVEGGTGNPQPAITTGSNGQGTVAPAATRIPLPGNRYSLASNRSVTVHPKTNQVMRITIEGQEYEFNKATNQLFEIRNGERVPASIDERIVITDADTGADLANGTGTTPHGNTIREGFVYRRAPGSSRIIAEPITSGTQTNPAGDFSFRRISGTDARQTPRFAGREGSLRFTNQTGTPVRISVAVEIPATTPNTGTVAAGGKVVFKVQRGQTQEMIVTEPGGKAYRVTIDADGAAKIRAENAAAKEARDARAAALLPEIQDTLLAANPPATPAEQRAIASQQALQAEFQQYFRYRRGTVSGDHVLENVQSGNSVITVEPVQGRQGNLGLRNYSPELAPLPQIPQGPGVSASDLFSIHFETSGQPIVRYRMVSVDGNVSYEIYLRQNGQTFSRSATPAQFRRGITINDADGNPLVNLRLLDGTNAQGQPQTGPRGIMVENRTGQLSRLVVSNDANGRGQQIVDSDNLPTGRNRPADQTLPDVDPLVQTPSTEPPVQPARTMDQYRTALVEEVMSPDILGDVAPATRRARIVDFLSANRPYLERLLGREVLDADLESSVQQAAATIMRRMLSGNLVDAATPNQLEVMLHEIEFEAARRTNPPPPSSGTSGTQPAAPGSNRTAVELPVGNARHIQMDRVSGSVPPVTINGADVSIVLSGQGVGSNVRFRIRSAGADEIVPLNQWVDLPGSNARMRVVADATRTISIEIENTGNTSCDINIPTGSRVGEARATRSATLNPESESVPETLPVDPAARPVEVEPTTVVNATDGQIPAEGSTLRLAPDGPTRYTVSGTNGQETFIVDRQQGFVETTGENGQPVRTPIENNRATVQIGERTIQVEIQEIQEGDFIRIETSRQPATPAAPEVVPEPIPADPVSPLEPNTRPGNGPRIEAAPAPGQTRAIGQVALDQPTLTRIPGTELDVSIERLPVVDSTNQQYRIRLTNAAGEEVRFRDEFGDLFTPSFEIGRGALGAQERIFDIGRGGSGGYQRGNTWLRFPRAEAAGGDGVYLRIRVSANGEVIFENPQTAAPAAPTVSTPPSRGRRNARPATPPEFDVELVPPAPTNGVPADNPSNPLDFGTQTPTVPRSRFNDVVSGVRDFFYNNFPTVRNFATRQFTSLTRGAAATSVEAGATARFAFPGEGETLVINHNNTVTQLAVHRGRLYFRLGETGDWTLWPRSDVGNAASPIDVLYVARGTGGIGRGIVFENTGTTRPGSARLIESPETPSTGSNPFSDSSSSLGPADTPPVLVRDDSLPENNPATSPVFFTSAPVEDPLRASTDTIPATQGLTGSNELIIPDAISGSADIGISLAPSASADSRNDTNTADPVAKYFSFTSVPVSGSSSSAASAALPAASFYTPLAEATGSVPGDSNSENDLTTENPFALFPAPTQNPSSVASVLNSNLNLPDLNGTNTEEQLSQFALLLGLDSLPDNPLDLKMLIDSGQLDLTALDYLSGGQGSVLLAGLLAALESEQQGAAAAGEPQQVDPSAPAQESDPGTAILLDPLNAASLINGPSGFYASAPASGDTSVPSSPDSSATT